MRVLVDTDILIDIALNRQPFADDAAKLIDYLQLKPGMGFVAWHSISNFYYLARPKIGRLSTLHFIGDLLNFIEVAPTGTNELKQALSIDIKDFEDALQVAAALACKANYIATRNIKDYQSGPVEALLPQKALKKMERGS